VRGSEKKKVNEDKDIEKNVTATGDDNKGNEMN
jgi:hypothetical protein